MIPRAKHESAVNPKILAAAKDFSALLFSMGVPHALIGGLAVGAHGYERATGDVDFLVSAESIAKVAGSALGGEVHGKTVVYKGVTVDILFPSPDEEYLEDAVINARTMNGIPTIGIEALVCMKLVAARTRDQGDVVELCKRGRVDGGRVVTYLEENRPDLVDDFESLVMQAKYEAD